MQIAIFLYVEATGVRTGRSTSLPPFRNEQTSTTVPGSGLQNGRVQYHCSSAVGRLGYSFFSFFLSTVCSILTSVFILLCPVNICYPIDLYLNRTISTLPKGTFFHPLAHDGASTTNTRWIAHEKQQNKNDRNM